MNQTQFLKAFENLQSDVKELKTLHQRILFYFETQNLCKSENSLFIEERISVKETCQILGLSEVSVWKLRKDGTLPYTQHKRTIRFKKSDIYNYLNQSK